MPTKTEVINRLVEMQSDLINTKNLLNNKDTMAAWDKLTILVKNKKKDQLKSGFENLENLIHRDFKVPPWKLPLHRKRYASGKEFILSAVEPNQEGVQKKQVENRTGASSAQPPLTADKKKKDTPKQGTKVTHEIRHESRPYSACGSHQDNHETKLHHLQQENEKIEKQLKDAQAKLRKAESDKEYLVEREQNHPLKKRYEEMEKQLKDTQERLSQSQTDKEYWMDRMSKLTGDKLTRDNPDIADLSDPKRPHKLGEKYSQLYDDEWTDAMEKLTETKETEISERRGIDILIDILRKSHESCIKLADDQMKKLQKAVIPESKMEQNGVMNCPIEVQRSLKDAQKQASSRSLPAVQEFVRAELASLKEQYGALPVDKLTSFVDKCTEICWGMVMQSPRMEFLFPDEGQGKRFDKDKFKEFTRSGDILDFLVWPAMVIQKQGSLLVKGSVQPMARKT
ncbi:girdin-like isoform X2 [Mizuhopecten yessoensis]|uniref:Mitochondria-eating protein n=1 Tax=Mizuhopecten yessoensis TaxID=6573 RepID=A0A210QJM8_MIZYE|nr:girdin-like isoform X2 [Mizuhopecten yessoensis]OWF48929.1 hypothetical protein KP79_PYT12461 [Mizuhopecten yessoensis]